MIGKIVRLIERKRDMMSEKEMEGYEKLEAQLQLQRG